MTVKFSKYYSVSGKFLHDEALSAEEPCTHSLLEIYRQVDSGFTGKEGTFLYNQFSAGCNLKCPDGAGETGCKGNQSFASHGCITVLEQSFTGEHTAEYFADSAIGCGLHLHIG